ncbi:hypothetical protein [Streptomyces sp. NPDC057302]|uniref:hypothetical protein n=1 Tax=Streptomyces sp. NPDC057302 TaxID=3346094 RepID=UPI003643D8E0
MSRLRGLDPHSIGLIAYQLCLRQDDPEALRAVSDALIHLRRFGIETFDPHSYAVQLRLRAQREATQPHRAQPADRGVLTVGEPVVVTGEPHRARVIHRTFAAGGEDLYPAPWYVTAARRPAICRAHGADELEPLPDPRLPTRRTPDRHA